jgi:hypothetical protein
VGDEKETCRVREKRMGGQGCLVERREGRKYFGRGEKK